MEWWLIYGLGLCVAFALGGMAGSSGTVSTEKYEQLRKVAGEYEKYWKEARQERDDLQRQLHDALWEGSGLKRAIRQSRKALDSALPPEITHTVK